MVCCHLHPTEALEYIGVGVVVRDDRCAPAHTIVGGPGQVYSRPCRVVRCAVLYPYCIEGAVGGRVRGDIGRIAPAAAAWGGRVEWHRLTERHRYDSVGEWEAHPTVRRAGEHHIVRHVDRVGRAAATHSPVPRIADGAVRRDAQRWELVVGYIQSEFIVGHQGKRGGRGRLPACPIVSRAAAWEPVE